MKLMFSGHPGLTKQTSFLMALVVSPLWHAEFKIKTEAGLQCLVLNPLTANGACRPTQ